MAQIVYRANLNSTAFPIKSTHAGQSIIVKQYDNDYVAAVDSAEAPDKDIGIPQAYYMHNVVPNAHGLNSIGYDREVTGIPGVNNFRRVHRVLDAQGAKAYLGTTADDRLFILQGASTSWKEINSVPGSAGKLKTVAYVQGQTYFYIQGMGPYQYDFDNEAFVQIIFTGLDQSQIKGITGVAGYIIAYSKDAVSWSSTTDPTDFVPSTITGAGGGGVEGAEGAITIILETVTGMIIYTETNAVAGVYSGNANYPFNYRKVVGCGGLADYTLAVADGNVGAQYAYTTYGLQLIGVQSANTIFPGVTDFLAGAFFEDFDEATDQFILEKLDNNMVKKMALVSGRYLVISYGKTSYTHALLYDISFKRWGKLKIPHIQVFEYNLNSPEVTETPKKSIGILGTDGSINIVNFEFDDPHSKGVLLLGKYQYIRQRKISLQTATFENIGNEELCKIKGLTSQEGKSFTNSEDGYLLTKEDYLKTYGFQDTTGTNFSILAVGGFYIISLVLSINVHGRL